MNSVPITYSLLGLSLSLAVFNLIDSTLLNKNVNPRPLSVVGKNETKPHQTRSSYVPDVKTLNGNLPSVHVEIIDDYNAAGDGQTTTISPGIMFRRNWSILYLLFVCLGVSLCGCFIVCRR